MAINRNHIVLDNQNVPVFAPPAAPQVKFGELVDVSEKVGAFFDSETLSTQHQLSIRDLYLPHFSLRSFSGEFKHDAVLINFNNKYTDEVINCFFYDGQLKAFLNSTHEVDLNGGTQLLRYDPQNEIKCWSKGNQPFHVVRSFTSPEYFLELLPENERWAEPIQSKILKKEKILQTGNSQISQAQLNILENILNCPLTGKSAQLMLETSVIQLVLLQLHSMSDAMRTPNSTQKFNKHDVEVMWAIKTYLSTNFLEDHSLKALTKTFGTNKFKLNTIFKSLFNVTPFEYIRNERLKSAKEWLTAGEPVNEVAQKLGYKNSHHFTAAFKKVFQMTPSEFKRYN